MIYDIKKGSVQVFDWVLETGQYVNEDTYRNDVQNLVAVEVEAADGSAVRLVHTHTFLNDPKGAERMARRVEERGFIDSNHWGHHGYLSLSMEERAHEEWVAEQHARMGISDQYNGPCAGGHD